MRRDTVFRRVVHLPCADLHLEGDLLLADDGGVQRLIHVRLGGGDIVLKAVGQRAEHVVHDAQHIIAIVDIIHDHTHRIYIVDFLQRFPLHVHFTVDAGDALDPAGKVAGNAVFLQMVAEAFLDVLQKGVALVLAQQQRLLDLMIGDGIEYAQRQILKLLLRGTDTEAVRQRRIDVHGLLRLIPPLLLAPAVARAHIVQAIRQLDDHDADVL